MTGSEIFIVVVALAFIYNGIGIPIAAGVLYPAFGLTLSPMITAGARALSSLSLVANAARTGRAVQETRIKEVSDAIGMLMRS